MINNNNNNNNNKNNNTNHCYNNYNSLSKQKTKIKQNKYLSRTIRKKTKKIKFKKQHL